MEESFLLQADICDTQFPVDGSPESTSATLQSKDLEHKTISGPAVGSHLALTESLQHKRQSEEIFYKRFLGNAGRCLVLLYTINVGVSKPLVPGILKNHFASQAAGLSPPFS